MSNRKFIPVYEPFFNGLEKTYVNECLDTGWISGQGSYIKKFEDKFSNFLADDIYSVCVANGTVALHLALLSLGIGPGDEVIVTAFTYIASINAIIYVGATPVFVDISEDSWNINHSLIINHITPKTKAIMAVHIYGMPCNMDLISDIAESYSLKVIEDSAEALGSKFNDKYVGTLGDISTFSFFGNKTLTTGEGGMIVSKDISLIERCRYLKSQAVSATQRYWHDDIGYNYRMTNICAAIGLAQLTSIDHVLHLKKNIFDQYKSSLSQSSINFQYQAKEMDSSYWLTTCLFQTTKDLKNVELALEQNLIDFRPLFPPVHKMPMYISQGSECPISDDIASRGLCLPSSPNLSSDDIAFICDTIIRSI